MKESKEFADELDNKLALAAEIALLDFGEAVVVLHGQFKGRYLIYYKIFEWLADKLMHRKG